MYSHKVVKVRTWISKSNSCTTSCGTNIIRAVRLITVNLDVAYATNVIGNSSSEKIAVSGQASQRAEIIESGRVGTRQTEIFEDQSSHFLTITVTSDTRPCTVISRIEPGRVHSHQGSTVENLGKNDALLYHCKSDGDFSVSNVKVVSVKENHFLHSNLP